MKVSLNWLREFVDLPPTTEALVELLTLAGVEVEDVIDRGVDIPNVVVAQIRESVQHPNADRLSVCQVEDGSGTARQIVCGAKNYRVNDKVPLALPGAVLPGDFKIKVGKLRGVESQGMLCSAKELALSEDAEGLLILAPEARIGAPVSELFPSDTVLDVEITPNRSDLLSHVGIAREIAALTSAQFRNPVDEYPTIEGIPADIPVAAEACRFYTARRISGVKVGPSPDWLLQRLEAVGLRSINNIVDVTNYVMFELGQPLHAFDAGKLEGDLNVRLATADESLQALDGKTYPLAADQLVIADGRRAVAIAGVMGGAETGVTESTTDLWLESAEFEPRSIRRTSRQLGLGSDSSYRFERGVDPGGVIRASERATELIVKVAGGTADPVRAGLPANQMFGVDPNAPEIDAGGNVHTHRVTLRIERLNSLLQVSLESERVSRILTALGLGDTGDGTWSVPSFRQDLTREVDLIEEVARVIGMKAIPSRVQARFAPASASDQAYDSSMALRRALAAHGFHEARSLTLVPAEPRGLAFTGTAATRLRRVRNPMIEEQLVLRPNLLHGLLTAVTANVRAGAKSVRLFELGRVFGGSAQEEEDAEEGSHVALVLMGPTERRTWRAREQRDADLFDLKGVLSVLVGAEATEFLPEPNPALALSLAVKVAGVPVGVAGQLWPADARALDATAPILFAEIDVDALAAARENNSGKRYRDIPRYPSMTRDIALLAPLTVPHETIAGTLESAREPLLAGVELFDVFTDPSGAKIPTDQRSLAYSLTYRSSDRTLTAEEVNAAHGKLKARLQSELRVSLRE